MQRNGPWALDAEGQIGEGPWGHATARGQQTSHRAGGLTHWVHSWRLCGISGALMVSPGPPGALWGPSAWLESAQTWVDAFQGFCSVGLLANSVHGLLLWREQDRGQGRKTAYRRPPAWQCRVRTSPTLHSLQGASQLEGGQPHPLPKARSSSRHGKSRDPASSHCPGRGVPASPQPWPCGLHGTHPGPCGGLSGRPAPPPSPSRGL